MENKNIKIKQEAYFEKKVIVSSFLLSILVIYIHANCLKEYGLQDNTMSTAYWTVNFIANGIGGIAVPMFFVLSGYLYFRNINFSYDIKGQIQKKQISRIKSIVIPYLLWNTFGMIFYMSIPRIPFVAYMMNGSYAEISLKNIIKGIFLHEYYFPLWYLKELIILISLTQIIGQILKNKKVSIIILSILAILGILNINLVILKLTSVYFFFLGSFLGTYIQRDFEVKKNNKSIIYYLIAFIMIVSVRTLSYDNILVRSLYLISPLFLWRMLDVFTEKFNIKPFMKQSFFVYCSHIIIITTVTKILGKIVKSNNEIGIIVNFLLSPIISLMVIYLIYKFLIKYLNKFYCIICGIRR